MINEKGPTMASSKSKLRRGKLGLFMNSEPAMLSSRSDGDSNHFRTRGDIFDLSHRVSNASAISPFYYEMSPASDEESPYVLSPWNQTSPLNKSPWASSSPTSPFERNQPIDGIIGSLVRKEGHIYSLAVSGDLLYTGSDSKNIRVWKNLKEFTGFKSDSGLVKAIIISGGRIFTGHQDGKIRVWKVSLKTPSFHKHIGNLPSFTDVVKSSVNPNNYVKVRRNRNVLRIKHFDAVSCMSLNEEFGLLYSGSWDRTVKVWRIADSKCLESITAHEDAINSVVSAFDGLLFTGSADGTVKVWRREFQRRRTKHFLLQVLMKQENAVTALAVNRSAGVLYCGTSDGVVNFWERKKRLSHGGVLRGHKLAVLCLASAGKLVFSGSADKSICVWRREETSGLHIGLAVLSGHTGPVKCLAVEEDHEDDDDQNLNMESDQRWIVYSGSLDKSVKVWRVSENPPELKPVYGQREIMHGMNNIY